MSEGRMKKEEKLRASSATSSNNKLNIIVFSKPFIFILCSFSYSSIHHSRFQSILQFTMGTDVTVEGVVIPQKFSDTNPLPRLAHGITGIEIHFLPIVHTVIGVYAEPSVASHLHKWKGKSGKELAEDDDFFAALAAAPVELVIRVVVIKEIKASQFGTPLEGKIRDRLVEVDKFEDEEEEALEKLAAFFPTKYFKKGDAFIFKFSASGRTEIELILGEKVDATTTVENANVSETIKKLYLGGTRGISPTLVENVANNLSAELAK